MHTSRDASVKVFILLRSGTPTKDVEKVDKAEKRKAMVGFKSKTVKILKTSPLLLGGKSA